VDRTYLVRRLAQVVPTVLVLITLAFTLIHAAPGDPILALAGEHGDEAYYAAMRERFGLDRPLGAQYVTYVTNVLQGDLGTSYVQGRPALGVVVDRIPATALLTLTALALSSTLGLLLGTVAASHRGAATDAVIGVGSLAGHAVPSFWLAQLALLFFSVRLGWFPVQGMVDVRADATGFAAALDVLRHLILPASVLAVGELALTTRLVRGEVGDALRSGHVVTARAKGLTERRVVVRHGLRNALLPVTSVIGTRLGAALSGAVLVEVVFAWPGLGRLTLAAIQARDLPVLLASFLVVALAVVLVNLLTDLVYGWLDPRVRLG
jgi:peptide/nickel transport system permease protein